MLTDLISLIPTLLTLVIIAVSMAIGFFRGARKSLIFLIHYIVSVVVGIIVYFQAISITYSDQLGGILSSLGPEFSEANSIIDVVHIYLEMFLPTFAGVTNNAYLQQFIHAVAGLGINLVLALICLGIVPVLVRTVLYGTYLNICIPKKT